MMYPAVDPADYGDACAVYYDELYPSIESGLLDCLQHLSGQGPILELGLATGRVAIPLAKRGIDVHAIEASSAMLEHFHRKSEANRVRAIPGDFATAECADRYRLIFSLVSTLDLLCSPDRQQQTLDRIAAHLQPDGCFVNESFDSGSSCIVEAREHQLLLSSGLRTYRVTSLAVPMLAFDEMAQRAGLKVQARWRNWSRDPFVAGDSRAITVYTLA